MNLPALLPVLEAQGIENPIVCSNINKIGFRMCGGLEAYEAALREHRFRAIAMSVFASGAIPADEAIEWVCAQPNIESIVFGASSARNIEQHARPRGPALGPRAGAAVDHAPRRLDGRTSQAAAPPAPPARRRRGPVPLGDLRHAAEPVAAGRRGRSTSCTSSAAATRATCCATCRSADRILREHDIDTIVSTGSAMALPVLRARPRARAEPALHRERRAQRRPVEDGAA